MNNKLKEQQEKVMREFERSFKFMKDLEEVDHMTTVGMWDIVYENLKDGLIKALTERDELIINMLEEKRAIGVEGNETQECKDGWNNALDKAIELIKGKE